MVATTAGAVALAWERQTTVVGVGARSLRNTTKLAIAKLMAARSCHAWAILSLAGMGRMALLPNKRDLSGLDGWLLNSNATRVATGNSSLGAITRQQADGAMKSLIAPSACCHRPRWLIFVCNSVIAACNTDKGSFSNGWSISAAISALAVSILPYRNTRNVLLRGQ